MLMRPLLRKLARTRAYAFYNRRFGKFDDRTIEFLIHRYSRARPDVFFIQVGANDGITWDPCHFFIWRDRWRGVVIEPQREVFENKLKATYQGVPGIKLMNVAIDAVEGSRPLYRYAFSSSRWATGLASFDRNRLIDNFGTEYVQSNIRRENVTVRTDPDEYVTSELVPCVTFDSVLDAAESDHVDFLITDVEGHDVAILDTFPLQRVRPANIVFELPLRLDAVFGEFAAKLDAHGYDLFISRPDAIAVRRDGVGM